MSNPTKDPVAWIRANRMEEEIESARLQLISFKEALRAEEDKVARLREALDRLARLGNEPEYGNSIGNQIARAALNDQGGEGDE